MGDRRRTADPRAPSITRKALCSCQIHEWYPNFRKVTLKTKFVELEPPFVEYLVNAPFILPKGCEIVSQSGAWSSDEEWENEDAAATDASSQPNLPEFDSIVEAITKSIEDLGGSVFPKLNWSAPRDTTWMNPGENLKCISASDVILLIKSSDFVVHDLCHAFDCCDPEESTEPHKPVLALRKWFDLQPSFEFRCFVKEGVLVGISQRDCSNFYEFLLPLKRQIVDTLQGFYDSDISGKFPEKSFVFDAYIRERDWKVFIIDFNPYGGLTQPLLFAWEELDSDEAPAGGPELRLISGATQMLPSMNMYSRMPQELHDMSDPRRMDDFFRANTDQLA